VSAFYEPPDLRETQKISPHPPYRGNILWRLGIGLSHSLRILRIPIHRPHTHIPISSDGEFSQIFIVGTVIFPASSVKVREATSIISLSFPITPLWQREVLC